MMEPAGTLLLFSFKGKHAHIHGWKSYFLAFSSIFCFGDTVDYYSPAMLGLKTDQEVLGELVKVKAPAVGQLMDQYPGIWTLVVSRWFICLYIDILPIEVRKSLVLLTNEVNSLFHISHTLFHGCRQFCGSGIVFSMRAPRFFSAWPWLSSFTTSRRFSELAPCLMCASASDRSPAVLSPWNVIRSCRCGTRNPYQIDWELELNLYLNVYHEEML